MFCSHQPDMLVEFNKRQCTSQLQRHMTRLCEKLSDTAVHKIVVTLHNYTVHLVILARY